MATEDREKGLDPPSIPMRIMKTYSSYGMFQIRELQRKNVIFNFRMNGRELPAV